MSSESINIIVSAEDKATGTLQKVEQNFVGMAKQAKEFGGRTKASVEVVGSLANAFGGTAIGAFASQLGGLTEKMSAFSEVTKTGTAGVFAFKLGIAAAAAAVTYSVAEKVASWWMQIDLAKHKAEEATKAFSSMSTAMDSARQKAFSQTREDVGLIRDPAEREQAINEAAAKLEKQSRELDGKLAKAREEVANKEKALGSALFKTAAKEDLDAANSQLDSLRAIRDSLDGEAAALRAMTSERAKAIEARKQENSLADKSQAFIEGLRAENEMLRATKDEQLKLEAQRNALPKDQGKAEQLLREREALRAQAEERKKAEVEAEQQAKQEEDAVKRIADLEKKRVTDLEARRIELVKGKEAAAAYRLEQEGLSKATAERLARQEELLRQDEAKAAKQQDKQVDTSPQQATQGRLLTRGTGGDPQTQILAQIKQLVRVAQDQLKADELYRRQKERGIILKTLVVP
jgi:hypothetical protein